MSDLIKQTYLSLDLELNLDSNRQTTDIIQVGISWGIVPYGIAYMKEERIVQALSDLGDGSYKIDPYIVNLTGITQEIYDEQKISHERVAKWLSAVVTGTKPFVNPIQWGHGDAEKLLEEFETSGVEFKHFGRRTIDVKTIFCYHQVAQGKKMAGGLRSALGAYGLQFVGRQHQAHDDAYNTLVLYNHLVTRQTKIEKFITEMK
jgi:inhibitor of KinA sporulation pathway (predicted exonuclease)